MPESRPSRTPSPSSGPSSRPEGRRFRQTGSAAPRNASNVQAPINAAEAAKHAAHATRPEEEARARRAALGTDRPSAATPSRRGGRARVAVAVLVGCALAAAILFVLGGAFLGVMLHDDRADVSGEAAQLDLSGRKTDGAPADGSQQQVALYADGDTIDAMSYTYSIAVTEDGRTIFGYQMQGSEAAPIELFEVAGDPVGFVVKDYVFYVVSNTEDGFCIQSIMHSDGGVASVYRTGDVTVASIGLDGTDLTLTDTDGKAYTVALGGTQ